MPGLLVVIPIVIAIIVTFVVSLTRSKDAARYNRHQYQQQACRFPSALSRTDRAACHSLPIKSNTTTTANTNPRPPLGA